MQMVVLGILVFAALMLYYGVFFGSRQPKTAAAGAPRSDLPPLFALFAPVIEALRGPLARTADSPAGRLLQKDLVLSGLPLTVPVVRATQLICCALLGLGLLALLLVASPDPAHRVLGLVFGSLIGWCLPVSWVRQKSAQRKQAISKELPFAIDLITVSMQAGQEFGAAVRQVVKESGPTALAQEFAVMLKEVELGKTRMDALKAMSDRIQIEEFVGLVSAVQQGTEMGASITKTLQIQAEELRRIRYHRAERKAARAPSLMIMPMALFILPSVFIIIFVPMLIRLKETGVMSKLGGG